MYQGKIARQPKNQKNVQELTQAAKRQPQKERKIWFPIKARIDQKPIFQMVSHIITDTGVVMNMQ